MPRRPAVRRPLAAVTLGAGLAALAALPHPAAAQAAVRAAAASLAGVVRDPAGAPVPNAHVALPALQRQTTTDAAGRFAFAGLPAGAYTVVATGIGRAPARAAVTVRAGAAAEVALALAPVTVRLAEVQVTATPTGTDPLRVAQSTTELAGRALDRQLGSTVGGTLQREPGVSQRFNGPAATTPVIRGLTGDRVLVVQDGQRAGDLSQAAPDHAVTVDPLAAQRIELVRGPASLLYGTQALGGVVNVITTDLPTQVPAHLEGTVATQAESASPGGAGSLAVTAPLSSRLALTARATGRSAQDYRAGGGDGRVPGTFARGQGGVVGLGYTGDRVSGGLVARGSRFDYGLPASVGSDDAGAQIRGDRREVAGRADVTTGRAAVPSVRLDGTAQWYGHDEVEATGAVGTSFALRTQTLGATARTALGPAARPTRGAVGVQTLFRQYASTGAEALTPAARTANAAAFVYQEVPLAEGARAPSLQVGGRYDLFRVASQDGGARFGPGRVTQFGAFSGSAGVSVPLGAGATLGASAARAFRAPTVEELYSNAFHAAAGTYDVGAPGLRPETNQGVDAVLRVRRARASGSLSAYATRIAGYVTPVVAGRVDRETGQPSTAADAVPLNRIGQADATMRGAEGQAEVALGRGLVAGAMGDLVRGQFRAGGALPFLPPARLGGTLRYEGARWSVGGDVRHAFAQGRVSQPGCARAGSGGFGEEPAPEPGTGGIPCVDVATGAYTVVDAQAALTFSAGGRTHALTLRADNLGDVRYFDAASRIKSFLANPGRNVSLGYRGLF